MKWSTLPLSALGTVQTGSTPSTSEARFWGGDVPFVTPAELEQRTPVTNTPRTLTDEGGREGRLLREGAVMVCCIGSLGKIGIAGRSLVTNQQINSVEFDPQRVFPKYGYYACHRLKSKLITMAPATTVPIVNKSKFEQLEIPVPPLPEQRRIAAILDHADALRVKRREALAQLDSLTQAIFIEMFGDPVTNPKGWKLSRLDKISDVGSSKRVFVEELVETGIPFFRGTEVGQLGEGLAVEPSLFISKEHFERLKAEAGVPTKGDLLLPSICPDGRIFMVQDDKSFYFKDGRVLWISVKTSDVNSYFLRQQLKQLFINNYSKIASGTTFAELKIFALKNINICLPPRQLQEHFASIVEAIQKQKDSFNTQQTELDNLFASLQHRAFRGELV